MATVEKALPPRLPAIKSVQDILGPSRNVAEINARLEWAARHCNLIAPATSIVHVPEFHAVSFTVARIGERDYYPTDDREIRFAFNKRGVTIIAGEANISWHPGFTRRMDDRHNPRYAEFLATAVYLNFDCTVRTVPANKSSDLNDESDETARIYLEASSPQRAESRLRNKRAFIREHVDSGAKVRAMKDCQVKDFYTREEIGRPFVIAKLIRTGQSDNPELQQQYALMQAEYALKASSALFGAEIELSTTRQAPRVQQPTEPLVHAATSTAQTSPPTVDPPARVAPPTAEAPKAVSQRRAAPPPAPQKAPTAQQPRQSRPTDEAIDPADFTVPFGRTKGTPLPQASDQDLSFLTLYYTGAIDNPDKAEYRTLNERSLKAVLIVKQRRAAAERAHGERS